MILNQTIELSVILDTDDFQRIFTRKIDYLKELEEEYVDTSLAAKGITVMYRDSRYKKRIRLLVNTSLVVDDVSDTSKLIRKLDKRITGYFDHQYKLDDFTLSGVTFTIDIDVGSRVNVSDYMKVIRRVGCKW